MQEDAKKTWKAKSASDFITTGVVEIKCSQRIYIAEKNPIIRND